MLTPSEMKERALRLVEEGNHIQGIYNYCDRWCERCQFTTRCLNFESGKDAPDSNSPEIWDYLKNVFEATMLMLSEKMEEMGIDPEDIEKMELPEQPDPKEHPLYKKAYNLSFRMHDWLQKNNPGINLAANDEIMTGIKEEDSSFYDSVEIVYFYNFFISAKIFRALSGTDDSEPDEIQTDSNGSAKIALIAIDRLIAGWSILMVNMMEQQDEILQFLVTLAELRKQTEMIFPLARKFVRPGFDG